MTQFKEDIDYLVIGGGFYGCCLALYLRSLNKKVLIVEAKDRLMSRASRVNQARIHTGFHYPRSAITAVKSMILHNKFMQDFPEAVIDNFQMLYAVARQRSKVSANRFHRMFRDIGAPIQLASSSQSALFDSNMVEAVFACYEAAFDYSILERLLSERLEAARVQVWLSTEVTSLQDETNRVIASLNDGREVQARYAFNVTYAQVNSILNMANLPKAQLKYELTELALVSPPPELNGIGVTLMDGPFFSCMPYPSTGLYSLTHVRYTPHESWTDDASLHATSRLLSSGQLPQSRIMHMIKDGQRFLPSLANAKYERSLFEIKTILVKNEHNDGRPILYQRKPANSRVISILGGKLDNVYDLFDLIRNSDPEFVSAHDGLLTKTKR